MEDCSEASSFSNDEEIVCPGPLFRVKMFVMGPSGSGIANFIQSLIGPSQTTSDQSADSVSISIWYPFKNCKGNDQLVGKKLTGEEHHLIIEIWNLAGRQICQNVYPMCLTASAMCVVVFNSGVEGNAEQTHSFFRTIQQKTDKVDRNKSVSPSGDDILSDLKSCADCLKNIIQRETEELRLLNKELKTKHNVAENVCRQKNTPKTRVKTEKTDSVILQEVESLEFSIKNSMKLPSRLHKVKLSNKKGLEELRTALLQTALDRAAFPHLDRTIKQSTIALYDEILKLRERGVVLLAVNDLRKLRVKDNETDSDDTLEEETAFLHTVGGLLDFNPKPTNLLQHRHKPTHDSPLFAEACRFICVHPCQFANMVCSCLVDDDKKAFRLESRYFWPKDSGFKRPDPQVLGRVLELIPQKGLIRESLFPLLWQNQDLDEQQILYALELLVSLGVLVPYQTSRDNCEGLALPLYPRLSVHRCHSATLMDLLPDNRPQLNWTVKPFRGDIQITWHFNFPMGLPLNVAKRFLAHCHYVGRNDNSYSYLWKHGVILRLGEAVICAEENGDTLKVSCRVNADEPGQEDTFAQVLWVTLATFVQASHSFLRRECPGLFYKESLLALGQQFYCDEKVDNEPLIHVVKALVMWKAAKRFTFKDGEVERELDMNLVFPFRGSDVNVSSVPSWLCFVASKRKDVMDPHPSNITASASLGGQKKLTSPFVSLKASLKLKRKKQRNAEIKWKLEEKLSEVPKPITNPVVDDKNKTASDQPIRMVETCDAETSQVKPNEIPASTVNFRERSKEDEIKEATRIATGFVAAIMASAVAEFIATECENNHNYKEVLSAAQIAAAKVTAEAAMATQSGDIDGAANAVLQAVRAVQPTVKTTPIGQIPMKSTTCTIL